MFMAERASGSVGLPGWVLALGAGIAGLLIAASGFRSDHTWFRGVVDFPRVLSTIFHEAAHALVCFLTGRDVASIDINSPDTGGTYHSDGPWFSSILVAFAGYAAPPLAGLGVAALIDGGRVRTALILTVVVMALVLTKSHDLLTRAYVVAIGFVAFAVVYWGSTGLQLWVANVEAWLLLLSEIVGLRRFRAGDANTLREKTLIPVPIWVLAWLALNGWALWVAVPLLWP
jgi:hypothetical protein